LARPDKVLAKAMESWVFVRVTDMRGVDLNVYRFNYDLTLAVLLMNPDGTIYASYAGRDFTDAGSHQSSGSLARVLDRALELHKAHRPKIVKIKKATYVERLAWWRDNKNAQKAKCFHCHQVHDAWQHDGRARGAWTERDQYTWPDPIQAGLQLDRENQTRLLKGRAPLREGDQIQAIGNTRTLAFGDIQRAVHEAPWKENRLTLTVLRDGKSVKSWIELPGGWKKPTPEIYAWRPMKWPMSPKPGFGGPLLDAGEKKSLSLTEDQWAFRVGYIVTWGPNAKTGHHAHRAGIRMRMVVHEVDGKSDFLDMNHFHAWFRMTRRPGRPVTFKVIQNGTPRTLTLKPLP